MLVTTEGSAFPRVEKKEAGDICRRLDHDRPGEVGCGVRPLNGCDQG
jgi:hypothetical protein